MHIFCVFCCVRPCVLMLNAAETSSQGRDESTLGFPAPGAHFSGSLMHFCRP